MQVKDTTIQDELDKFPRVSTLSESQPAPIVDEVSASLSYIGYAPLGASQGDAKWKILRITKTGNVTITEYADGDMLYDNIWTSRASTVVYAR